MFKKRRSRRDFREEIEAHLQLEGDELRERGLSATDARGAARREFGNVMRAEERFYESGRVLWWEHLRQDIRFGLRMLLKTPGFTIVSVLILALAIGANTAIFSAVYAVLLQPLPFKNADELVFIQKQNAARGWVRNQISPPEILAWHEQSGVFQDMAAIAQRPCVLTGSGEVEQLSCETASSNLFSVLGVRPLLGRTFTSDEDKPEAARVAILSYALWQRRFAADAGVIGRSVTLDGTPHTIVGVMPRTFSHLYASPFGTAELWVSGIALAPENVWNDYWGIARLKPGIGLPQAGAALDTISTRLERTQPELKGWRAQLLNLRTVNSADIRPALLVLMAAVGFVLLIACANIANLLLARGAGRAAEFAARSAMGASRGRIVRQLLTESLVLSLAGGLLGVLLASFGCKALVSLAPPYMLNSAPGLANGATDLRVLAFSLFTVVVTTVLFGLAPALQSSRQNLAETLKEGGRSSMQGRASRRFRNVLVVSEIALALVLLVGAGLMMRTLALLNRFNLGFNVENVLTLRVPLSGERYKQPEAQAAFWKRVVAAIERSPGVECASVSRDLPVDGWAGQWFTTAEQPNPPAGQIPDANYIVVGPDYFRTMEIPFRQGRSFDEHDTQTAARVVIVNEELAQRYWPGESALGKQLRPGAPGNAGPWLMVVGVVANVRSQGPAIPATPELYVPVQQFPWLLAPQTLVVRASTSVKPESLEHAVVQEIHRIDAGLPVTDVKTLEQVAAEPLRQQRMVMALLVAFAGLALALAALGIYSVLSYSTAQRTREIGVRIALGAQRAGVLRLIIGDGLGLVAVGIVLGIVIALGLTRLMADLLFGVTPTDLATFILVVTVVTLTSLLACHIPARRAVNIDPITALRHE